MNVSSWSHKAKAVATFCGFGVLLLVLAGIKPYVRDQWKQKSITPAEEKLLMQQVAAMDAFNNARLAESKNNFAEALQIAKSIDVQTLNDMYAGWGDIVKTKYLPALALLADAKSEADYNRGVFLHRQFQTWCHANQAPMAERLVEFVKSSP